MKALTDVVLRPIHQMVDALPADGWWTPDLRRRWMRALEGALDYAIEERDSAPRDAKDDDLNLGELLRGV